MTIVSIAAPVIDRIGYLEAWRLWIGGQQPPSDAVLWGVMSLRWWARTGKIAAFVGGATVILDLVGPERLRQFGRTTSRTRLPWWTAFPVMAVILAPLGYSIGYAGWGLEILWILVPVGGILGLTIFWGTMNVPLVVGNIFDKPSPALVLRYAGVVLLFVGFHFDLLSS